MSLKPVLPGGLVQVPSSSGGSSGLPVWTYVAGGGSPAPGTFTANSANPSTVTLLNFSVSQKGDATALFTSMATLINNSTIFLKGASGPALAFIIGSTASSGGLTIFNYTVSPQTAQTTWVAGDYGFSLWASVTLSNILATAGITPTADSTTTPVTSITTQTGIVTAKA